MNDKNNPDIDQLDEEESSEAEFLYEEDETETIDIHNLFSKDMTRSGSFDVRGGIWASAFGKLIQALPIPSLLVDTRYSIVAANQACGRISPDSENVQGSPYVHLFPDLASGQKGLAIAKQVFSTREPQSQEMILQIGNNRIWGRLSFRSIRIVDQRFLLVMVEDLTLQRKQLQQKELLRKELEKRVKQRTFELVMINEQMKKEIRERKQLQESLYVEKLRLQMLSENAPFGMAMIGEDGKLLYINAKFKELFGYNLDELPTMNHWFAKAFPDPERRRSVISGWVDDLNRVGRGKQRPRVHAVTCRDRSEKIIHFRPVQLRTGEHLITCEDITVRKEAEDALRESEATLRSVLQAAPMGIGLVTHGSRLGWTNEMLCRMTGYSSGELVGQDERTLYETDRECERVRQVLYGRIYGRTTGYVETRWKRKDGSTFDLQLSSSAIVPGEVAAGVVITATDITEKKKSEEALRKWGRIFEHAQWGVVVGSGDGQTLELMNPAYAKMHGYTVEELTGADIVEVFAPESRAELSQHLRLARERGHYTFESKHIRKDGTVFPVLIDITIVKTADTQILYSIVNVQDITERKKTEDALRESEEKYGNLFRWSNDAVLIHDLSGNIMDSNYRARELFGHTEEEMATRKVLQLHPEQALPGCHEQYEKIVEEGNVSFEADFIKKSGDVFPAEVSSSLLEISGRTLVQEIVRDITNRRQLEEQLRQAAKMEAIGQLAGGIAHDFNNLLTAIMGYSGLLMDQTPRDHPNHKRTAHIHRAAERAAGLTQQLLAFSRKQVLDAKVLDLNSVIDDFRGIMQRLIGEHIDLSILSDDSLGTVSADSGQIEQVLLNLVINARDAMPEGGQIRIQTANVELDEYYAKNHAELMPGDYVMFSVADAGHGIDARTRAKIFDPFFTTKEKGVGTGLGLATVYGIVKQHGGHISAYSEPGQGTTFKIFLPRVEAPLEEMSKTRGTHVDLSGNETILVVEDEVEVLDLTCEALEMLGYSPIKAGNPEEAIKISREFSDAVDLLLTDVVLPKMDGKSLFSQLAVHRPDMKILYMSGHTEDFIVHHGVLDQGVNFLHKPFTVLGLASKVREVLDQS
ncbi:PAS domain S-box protein [Thermodesulfobacteriota bacterium]